MCLSKWISSRSWIFEFYKRWEIYWPAWRLSASQEGLCSMLNWISLLFFLPWETCDSFRHVYTVYKRELVCIPGTFIICALQVVFLREFELPHVTLWGVGGGGQTTPVERLRRSWEYKIEVHSGGIGCYNMNLIEIGPVKILWRRWWLDEPSGPVKTWDFSNTFGLLSTVHDILVSKVVWIFIIFFFPYFSSFNPFKPKMVEITSRSSVLNSKETQCVSVTKVSRLMSLREIIAVYSENHTKSINTSSKTQMYWRLKLVVHIVTTGLNAYIGLYLKDTVSIYLISCRKSREDHARAGMRDLRI
jgi:hypothetical protein